MIKVITYVAYRCGDLLASPWAIVFFAFVSLTALPQTLVQAVGHGDIAGLVGWFSQNFVQLVSLAVLAFIADRQGRAAQVRGDEMYDWLSDLHGALHEKLDTLHEKLDTLHEKVDAATGADR